MKKLDKLFLYSLIGGVVLTLLIIFMPNSINEYYPNPEIYDNGFNYYLWKFRTIDQSIVARVTSWVFFIAHFVTVVVLMKKLKANQKDKQDGFTIWNVYLLLANVFFILLHYVHTWIWYDALAQDTPVWSSQGSVIIMLVLILIIENRRRGLFFGKKAPLPQEATRTVMKHHGIYIALATIFTFWYHPMENTPWHLVGFFYMYLLFIQMSFSRTKIHQNKYFNVALEITVLFHGTSVALYSGNAPWAMFLFGFAAIFFVTQIYGLGLSKKWIHVSQGLFVVIALLTYSGLFNDKTFVDMNEIIRIPAIEYLLVFLFVFGIYGWIKLPVGKIAKRIIGGVLITVMSIYALLVMYTMSSYQPDPLMYDYIDVPSHIFVTEDSDHITYEPDEWSINIIIIPGGKVNPESYSYLAQQLAKCDFRVTIVKEPFNLAILNVNKASKYLVETTNYRSNVIIGHSLGGVTASMFAEDNKDVDLLITLGAYSLKELDIPVLYLVGENEKLLDNPAYEDSKEKLSDLTEIIIPGGNHAYFGFYGEQKGDGTASITNKQQQDFVKNAVESFIYDEIISGWPE